MYCLNSKAIFFFSLSSHDFLMVLAYTSLRIIIFPSWLQNLYNYFCIHLFCLRYRWVFFWLNLFLFFNQTEKMLQLFISQLRFILHSIPAQNLHWTSPYTSKYIPTWSILMICSIFILLIILSLCYCSIREILLDYCSRLMTSQNCKKLLIVGNSLLSLIYLTLRICYNSLLSFSFALLIKSSGIRLNTWLFHFVGEPDSRLPVLND